MAIHNRKGLWATELTSLTGELRAYLEYLRETLPISDLYSYPFSLFEEFARHGVMVREAMPWCRALSQEVFREYVLFPRINDEDLSSHRELFYGQLHPRVEGLPLEEAVLEVNRWAHENVTYQAQDDRTASPLTVYRNGSGRCGEESTFVVAALRSVGIAARQVYAPRWSHCDDNHAWVEALCHGQWRFFGACEPEPVLDKGWFNAAAARAVLIHSRRFHPNYQTEVDGSPLGRAGAAAYYNQTERYAPTQSRSFRLVREGKPVAGATLRLQVLNEARLTTIATLETGADGCCTVMLGKGDVHVSASCGEGWAEAVCHWQDNQVLLELQTGDGETGEWRDFDFHAPPSPDQAGPALSAEQKQARKAVLEAGNSVRNARVERFFDEKRAEKHPHMEDILRLALGNFSEIADFLERDGNPLRERLLRSLREKDLRDCTAHLLEGHLSLAEPYAGKYPREVFDAWLLCPRVADEPLTPWRKPIGDWVEKHWPGDTPRQLWESINGFIHRKGESHSSLYWPPEAAALGQCDERSLRVLYVAALRARGIPARLREVDGIPEYWHGDGFVPVCGSGEATAVFLKSQEQRFRYGKNWGVARWEKGDWLPMQLSDHCWTGDRYGISLPVGIYRVITVERLPGGDQFASCGMFRLELGQQREIPLRLRIYELKDILAPRALPAFGAATLQGEPVGSRDIGRDGRPSLLFWLEEGTEPTEHILNELMEAVDELEKLPVHLYFFVRDRESLGQETLASLLARLPAIRVGVGEWDYTLENMARQLYCDPERPPLTVVCDGEGRAVYATCGYNVNTVQLLLQILGQLGAKNKSGTWEGGAT